MNEKTTVLLISPVESDKIFFQENFGEKYTFIVEESFLKGYETIKELKVRISLVIIDVNFIEFEAQRLIDNIKSSHILKDIPIIAIIPSLDDVDSIYAEEVDDFLVRPFSLSIVKMSIRNMLYKNFYYGYQLEMSLKETNYKIVYDSRHDSLTDVYNRETFYKETSKFLDNNKDNQYYIVVWDISRFRVINDLYGKEIGDKVLITLGSFFNSMFRKTGTFGRLDADHFATCIPEEQLDVEGLLRKACGALQGICNNFEISLNIGIYKINDLSTTIDQMCSRASLAKDTVKSKSLQRYAYYDDELRNKMLEEQEIINDMAEALKSHQFFVNYQPVYSISKNRTISAEALVRWKHPRKGIISPGSFIPVFEKNGTIGALDYYVWEEVCRFLKFCKDNNYPLIPISVNVSRINFYNPNLATIICDLAQKYKIEPGLFRIEITESAYTDDPDQLISVVEELKRNGFIILMDDFGSGFSSLNLLKDMPIDILKIDMQFIKALDISDRAGSILSSIIRMVKWLEIAPIAEGVENQVQFDYLKSVGCDRIQGFFYEKPLSESDYLKLLKNPDQSIKNYVRKPARVSLDQLNDIYSIFEKNSVFNDVIGATGICEYEDGMLEVLKVNPEYFEITASDPTTFYQNNKNELSWVYEDDRALVISKCEEALLSDKVVKLNFRRYNTRSEIVWISCRILHVKTKDVDNLLFFSLSDITSINLGSKDTLSIYAEPLKLFYNDVFSINTSSNSIIKYKLSLFEENKEFSTSNDLLEYIYKNTEIVSSATDINEFINENKGKQIKGNQIITSIVVNKKGALSECIIDLIRFAQMLDKDTVFVCLKDNIQSNYNEVVYSDYQFDNVNTPISEKRRVMIVDDCFINRKIIKEMLAEYYDIVEMENARYALNYLKGNNPYVSAILLDLEMPVMNGYEFLKYRENDKFLKTIPVLVLSQNTSKETEIETLQLGACEFLKKPYEPVMIIQRLNNIVRLRDALEDQNAIKYLLNNLPTGIVILDINDEHVTMDFYNYGFLELVEWSPSRVFTSFDEILDGDEKKKFKEAILEKKKYHESFYIEGKLKTENMYKWIGIRGSYVGEVKGSSRYYVAVTDINKYKMSELLNLAQKDLINKQYSMLNHLYQTIPCGIIQFDSENNPMISFSNDLANEFLKSLSSEEAKSIYLFDVLHPDDLEYTKNLISSLAFDKNEYFECRVIDKNNDVRWINGIFNKTKVIDDSEVVQCAFFDITQKKKYELALLKEQEVIKQMNKKYELVISYTKAIIWEYNLKEDTVYLSEEVSKKLKHRKSIKKASKVKNDDVIIYENEKVSYDVIYDALKTDIKYLTYYTILKDSKGKEKYFNVSYVKIFDPDGDSTVAIGFARDCTDEVETSQRYELEKEYRKAYSNDAIMFIEYNITTGVAEVTGKKTENIINWNNNLSAIDNLHLLCDKIVDYSDNDYLDGKNIDGERFHICDVIEKINEPNAKHDGYFECRIQASEDVKIWVSISYYYVVNPTNNSPYLFISICDINNRKITEIEAIEKSKKDSLSDLLNRTAFEKAVKDGIETYYQKKLDYKSAFIMIDIDNFKAINDNFGHQFGDAVIKKISENIKKHFGNNNLIARIGGDEFAIYYKNITSIEDIKEKGDKFCRNIVLENSKYGRIEINCSIGISIFPEHGTTFENLYLSADIALYNSKIDGKCQCRIFDAETPNSFSGIILNNDWLLNAINVLIWIVDVESKNILYANNYFKRIVYNNPEGRKWYSVIEEGFIDEGMKNYSELSFDNFTDLELVEKINGKPCMIETKIIKWNGKDSYLNVAVLIGEKNKN